VPRRFHAPELHGRIIDEAGEDAHRVAAAADASDDVGRQAAVAFEHLGARFDADHLLNSRTM